MEFNEAWSEASIEFNDAWSSSLTILISSVRLLVLASVEGAEVEASWAVS